MQHKEAIAALINQLDGLSQDKTLGVIGTSEYWVQHQAISKQISKLREDQPSNFYSPEPTPEEVALKRLKNRVLFAIEPYRFRVAGKDWNALLIALKFATDSNQVEALYNTWQGKLRHKNLADLPDLHAKPKPVKQISKEAA